MTMMVVALLGDRTKDEWYAWVKGRVERGEPYATPKEFVEPFGQGGNGPRGALMGGQAGGAAGGVPAGILGGALRVGSTDGGISLSFPGSGGAGEDDSEDEGELDLPAIQAALRARMAELEREEAMEGEDGEISGPAQGASITDDADMDDVEDKRIEDVSETEGSTTPKDDAPHAATSGASL